MKRLFLSLVVLFALAASACAEFSFPDTFLPEGQPAILSETGYRSQSVAIEITSMRVDHSDVYIADIHLRDVRCLRRAFGGGAWNTKSLRVRELAEEAGAILAMTGDNAHGLSGSWLIGNGELLQDKPNAERDLCLLYKSGEMRTVLAQDIDNEWLAAEAQQLWQVFCFGPALLDEDGKALTVFNSNVKPANPRSVIGYYEPGHYCFVQVDGRGTASKLDRGRTSRGLTMAQLAAFMEELGCQAAYNLDGGQSSMMWFGDDVISTPYKGGRRVGDVVVIAEPPLP